MIRRLLAAIVIASGVLTIVATEVADAAPSAVLTWKGETSSTDWSVPENWQPAKKPDATDFVSIAQREGFPAPVVDVPGDAVVAGLTVGENATLDSGAVTVLAQFVWSSGNISASVTVAPTATGLISGSDPKALRGSPGLGQLHNEGALQLTSEGEITLTGHAGIINDGTLTTFLSPSITTDLCCINPPHLINNGTIAVAAPRGHPVFSGMRIEQFGTIDVGGGSLDVPLGFVNLHDGSKVTGKGAFVLSGSAFATIDGNVELLDRATVRQSQSADLDGSGTITGGTYSWTGGDITADLTIAATTSLKLTGRGQKLLHAGFGGGTLTNLGATSLAGKGALVLGEQADFVNVGTFTVLGKGKLASLGCCIEPDRFDNQGVLRLAPSGMASPLLEIDSVRLEQHGEVQITSGTVELSVAPSVLADGSELEGAGRLLVTDGATLEVAGTIDQAHTSAVEVTDGGYLVGAATVRGGTVQWTGGEVTAALTLDPSTTLAISGPANKALAEPGRIVSQGALTATGPGEVSIDGGPTELDNAGAMTVTGDVRFTSGVCCVDPSMFENTGAITVSPGVRLDVDFTRFVNHGTVVVDHGVLATQSADLFFNDGLIHLDAGVLGSSGTLSLAGGRLEGTGTVDASLTSAAEVAPGAPIDNLTGTLAVEGDYAQLPTGFLLVDVGGTVPGGDLDLLDVSGSASLAGTLFVSLVPGFTPNGTSDYRILVAGGPRSGTFSSSTGLDLLGPNYAAEYSIHRVVLSPA